MNVPWLPYLATKYMEGFILPPFRCFEWGSGGSTYWLAARCRSVVSVEHEPARLLTDLPQNVETLLIPIEEGEIGPDPSDPEHYKSASTEIGKMNFRRYCHAIDDYGKFDLVLVDGMAHASCIALAVSHVRPGGWLVVDNTGDRPYYLEKTGQLFGNWDGGWERVTFFGRGPLLSYLWETSIFRKPPER